jgi:hypothetical protein
MKIRHIIGLLLLILCSSALLLSQEPGERTGRSRGLYLGLSASNFAGSDASAVDNKFIPGFSLGFYQDFIISHRYSIETGLLLSSKGSRLDAVGDLYMHQVLTYLEIPVLVECMLVDGEKLSFHMAGGAYLGLKLLAFNEVGFPEEINCLDIGVDLGLGVRFRHFSFRLDVKRGFLSIDKSEPSLDYKNLTFSLLVGISF